MTDRKTGRKNINKLFSRPVLILLTYGLLSGLYHFFLSPIRPLNKPLLTNDNWETVHTKWRDIRILMVLYVFIPLF